jgi:hypothetical protein
MAIVASAGEENTVLKNAGLTRCILKKLLMTQL